MVVYGLSLLVVLGCLYLVDRRYKLAFAYDKKRTALVLVMSWLFFVVWDVVGIWQKLFYTGDSQYITHLFIIKDFPIEELLFLMVLVYSTLLVWRFTERIK